MLPPTEAVVVGAGMAGLSCATRLAELGHRVTVVEARRVLGGRAASWIDARSGSVIDNGPHLFAGAYRETSTLLRRIGTLDRVPLSRPMRIPLWSSSPPRRSCLGIPAGTGRLGPALALARFDALPWQQRVGLLSVMRAAAAEDVEPDRPLAVWLEDQGQSARARRWFWDPLARAVFSEDPARVSARLFAGVLRRLFLEGPASSALAHARYGLSDTYAEPAARYLRQTGNSVLRGQPVRAVKRSPRGFLVDLGQQQSILTRGLCLATPASDGHPLLAADLRASCPGLEAAAGFPSAPIVSANLWFRGTAPLLPEAIIGLVDGGFSWIFDRTELTADAGGGRHLVLIAPGARQLLTRPAAEIVDLALTTLRRHCDGDLQARLLGQRVVKEPHAAPSLTPEVAALRPSQETDEPGLALAGDWTDTGLPATMESAADSGHRAAGLLHRFLRRGA